MKHQFHWFYFVPLSIFIVFMGIMTYATYRAYSRTPGSTGQDMSEIQQVRYQTSAFSKSTQKTASSLSPNQQKPL